MKHYEINISLSTSFYAENEEDAIKEAHDFLNEVSNSRDMTNDELTINELE